MASASGSPKESFDYAFTADISTTVSAEAVCAVALRAGDAIMAVYDESAGAGDGALVATKSDDSPLTRADLAANEVIVSSLRSLYPHVPVVTEEQRDEERSYEERRRRYQYFFCVDPLDGTKEFVKRNGQFTVNIALVRGDRPVLGVVYVPVGRKMYWGVEGKGSYSKVVGDEGVTRLRCRAFSERDEGISVVGSKSHSSPATDAFVSKYARPEFTSMGSSLKFMLVAEGAACVYPRFAPTCEWDTCASQIIVEEAGGRVVQAGRCGNKGEALEDWRAALRRMEPVVYNKRDLLNPFFVVFGNRAEGDAAPLACEPDTWFKSIFG